MPADASAILAIVDRCSEDFFFPILDNGYVYLAATRLSLFRSRADWALVIEVFGFAPRAGLPDTAIYTFASRLHERDGRDSYVNDDAYQRYLANHPHDEMRTRFPIDDGSFQDVDNEELVAREARNVSLRGRPVALPSPSQYAAHGIELESPPRVRVFELCRYLAAVARDDVLATPRERRVSVPPDLDQILQLEEWHHPDVADPQNLPSRSPTFQQLARVLETGDVTQYRPTCTPNTHWQYWPEGGKL